MAVVIDTLELVPAPAPDQSANKNAQETAPPPPPSEAMETALRRLEQRQERVWAH